MINNIKYYYGIIANDIVQKDDDYYFDNYVLKLFYKELNIELYNYLLTNKIYVHKIIYNRNNEYITYINDKPYILFYMQKNDKINLSFLSNYNIVFNHKNNTNWAILWSVKVDYYEKNYNNIKDNIIKESFNYFIGMAENAILLFKKINISNNICLCHERFSNNDDFYNPLNLIIDYKVRDYAEYIKNEFYNHNKYYYDYIKRIIYKYNYNDVMLFFIRMLFPSTFFDEYDNYIKQEKVNYNFFYKKYEYEIYLKKIYKEIRKKYNVPTINWLQ